MNNEWKLKVGVPEINQGKLIVVLQLIRKED